MTTEIQPTCLEDYIKELLPGAHGHQIKAIATFVATIIAKQTGCQAELARTQGNQEAAVKRLSRLLHNERICQKTSPNGSADRHLNNGHAVGKCV
jgi:hypothetical protein